MPHTILNVLYDERIGGPQLRVLQVARELQPDFRTIVVIPTGSNEFAQLLRENGIPVYQIPLKRLRDTKDWQIHFKWLVHFWPNVWQLMKIIRKEQVDIVHTNGVMHLQSPIAAKLARAKLVWHLNDVNPRRLIRSSFLPFVSFLSDEVAVSSNTVASCYFGGSLPFLRRETYTLYAPVNVDDFALGRSVRIQSELQLGNGACVIGTVGNINPVKGHRYFLEAAALVKEQVPQAKFLIVGRKLSNRQQYFDSLQQLVRDLGLEDALIFTGQRKDIPDLLQSLDIYVHPSLAEACPMAVLEAMAAAKPIVATAVGGVPEVVGEAGVLVPPRDPESLAKAIIELWQDPQRARGLGMRARKRVEERFSLDICIRRHKELYERVMGECTGSEPASSAISS